MRIKLISQSEKESLQLSHLKKTSTVTDRVANLGQQNYW